MICALLIVGGLLLISGYKKEPTIEYWIEFNESVLGLGPGGQVVYMGVPVGTVSDIYVNHENKVHVTVQINMKTVTLHEGVKAQLVLYSLATGTLAVSLAGGDLNKPILEAGSKIESERSLVEALSTRIEDILDDLNEILSTVKTGLVGVEEGDLAEVIDDAREFLKNAQKLLKNADEALSGIKSDTEGGIGGFKKLVEDTNKLVNTINKKVEELDVAETGDGINKAVKEVAALVDRLQNTAEAINELSRAAELRSGNLEYNFRETLRSLDESLNAIRDLANFIRENPSALIRGRAGE